MTLQRRALLVVLALVIASGHSLGIFAPTPPSADAAAACPTGFTLTGSACELTISASGQWVVPSGVASVDVLVVGGGGGGGGFGLPEGAGGAYGSGGGGGGGQVRVFTGIPVTVGQAADITIGSGGSGGGRANDGSAGQDSTFLYDGTPRTAVGGEGGDKGTLAPTGNEDVGGSGGAGGADSPTGTGGGAGGKGGNWRTAGANGTDGRTPTDGLFSGNSTTYGGGGGGGSGYPMDGSRLPGGSGGDGGGGNGGDGGASSNSPNPSASGVDGRGGGGGGGSQGPSANRTGASGGAGVVIVRIATIDVCDDSAFAGGDGSSADPYQISNATQLAALAADSACYSSQFIQTADITLSGPWTPIGDSTDTFQGTYGGNGKAITGLVLPQQNYSGLFGATDGATISGLDVTGSTAAFTPAINYVGVVIGRATSTTVSNVTITSSIEGVNSVGGAVGHMQGGSISNVNVTGDVTGSVVNFPGDHVGTGGLIGSIGTAAATVTDVSVSSATVTGAQYVGGMIGKIYGGSGDGELTITRMSSSAEVVSTVTNFWEGHVGGAIGSIDRDDSYVHVSDSTASGSVTTGVGSTRGGNVGGFAGSAIGKFTIQDSSASGDVAASYAIGGFIGYLKEEFGDSQIQRATATGNVTATGAIVGNIGGFFGEANATSPRTITITNSSASGSVSASTGTSVGGFGGGVAQADIVGSHASGRVTGGSLVGGFIGNNLNSISISDSYASGNVDGNGAVGGFVGSHEAGGTLSDVYATGRVRGGVTGDGTGWEAGGLVGRVLNGGAIERAFATGDVSGVTRVGGLVGELDGTPSSPAVSVTDSYATGSVTGSDASASVGGIVGLSRDLVEVDRVYATGAVTSSSGSTYLGGVIGDQFNPLTASSVYWNTQTTGTSFAGGTSTSTGEAITGTEGLTSSQMRSSSSFVGWDFTSVWGYQCGVSATPALRWANAQATSRSAGACSQPTPSNGGGTAPPPSQPAAAATTEPQPSTPASPSTPEVPAPQAPGTAGLLVDGIPVPVSQMKGSKGKGLALSAGDMSFELNPTTSGGRALPLAADGTLVVARTGELPVSGSGLAPDAPFDVTIYSTPTMIATAAANSDGDFLVRGEVPGNMPRGAHTLVITSQTEAGEPFTLSLGITVTSPAAALGANPKLRVKPKEIHAAHNVQLRLTAAQPRCRVTFSLGKHKKTVATNARGRAVVVLTAPNTPRIVTARAQVTGKGCDRVVKQKRIRVAR